MKANHPFEVIGLHRPRQVIVSKSFSGILNDRIISCTNELPLLDVLLTHIIIDADNDNLVVTEKS